MSCWVIREDRGSGLNIALRRGRPPPYSRRHSLLDYRVLCHDPKILHLPDHISPVRNEHLGNVVGNVNLVDAEGRGWPSPSRRTLSPDAIPWPRWGDREEYQASCWICEFHRVCVDLVSNEKRPKDDAQRTIAHQIRGWKRPSAIILPGSCLC